MVGELITLSELQLKEVVLLQSGRRLGIILDFEIDDKTGAITALIVSTRPMRSNLFHRATETIVSWEQIVTIGDDFILINDEYSLNKVKGEVENDQNHQKKENE